MHFEPGTRTDDLPCSQAMEKPTEAQINAAERDFQELIERKKQIERNLINLEVQIYNYETCYLEETNPWGNLLRGLDGYLGSRSERRRGPVQEDERVFSRSSATFQKALSIHERLVGGDDPANPTSKRGSSNVFSF